MILHDPPPQIKMNSTFQEHGFIKNISFPEHTWSVSPCNCSKLTKHWSTNKIKILKDLKKIKMKIGKISKLGSLRTISWDQPCKDGNPIHNGTIESFVWSRVNQKLILKTDNFQLGFCDLRILLAGQHRNYQN